MVEGNTLEDKCEILEKFLPHTSKLDQNLLFKLKNDKSYKLD